ncbi:M48 family metalloprotease [Streptomyces sp. NPDC051940]|uniref:M48 family metalloprotease n=1 Tax=Streptomyces sp. NPDC051940 TaxID=3155675 RepID=UPI00344452D7
MSEGVSAGVSAGERRACPDCGADMPVDPRFVVWCDGCGWNVDPVAEEPRGGRLAAFQRRLARTYGERLYAELSGGRPAGRPRRDATTLAAYAVAWLVHGVTVALLVGGVLFIALGWGKGIYPAYGVFCLALVVLLRPRFPKLDDELPRLRRQDAPQLFELLDRIADDYGTRRVDVVEVSPEYNASVMAYGIRRGRRLEIGMALWSALGPQERVALLGHEFGHFVNGDTGGNLVIGTAMRSLSEWIRVLVPDRPSGPVEFVISAVMTVPYALAVWTAMLLSRLMLRSTQRAEYHADDLAARTGSSEAAAGLFDRLAQHGTAESVLRRQSALAGTRRAGVDARAIEDGLWEQVTEAVRTVPPRELERLRRVDEARGHAVDTTHPPTHLRARRIREGEQVPARITLDEAQAKAVDEELRPAARRLARVVVRDLAQY